MVVVGVVVVVLQGMQTVSPFDDVLLRYGAWFSTWHTSWYTTLGAWFSPWHTSWYTTLSAWFSPWHNGWYTRVDRIHGVYDWDVYDWDSIVWKQVRLSTRTLLCFSLVAHNKNRVRLSTRTLCRFFLVANIYKIEIWD